MASPFSIFRKNQKILMALLVGLSMIAFVVADSINAENFPIFLGAVLGALALWLLSGKGGSEGWLIAGVGALLGAIVGLYGPSFIGDNTAVYTAEGNLSNQEVVRLSRRQDLANQFLRQAAATVAEKLPEEQQASYQMPALFGFVDVTDAGTQRENAALTYLFGKEADELGITLTDAAVQRFILDVTQNKLTDAEFRRIRSDLQVGTGELIDVLREQIRAREAARLLVPQTGPTPQDLWADYRKLSAEAEVTAVAVPAEAFVSQIDAPSEEELTQFFEEYKAVPLGADGTPGFLVPRQVQVAYLEIALDDVKKTVTPPTDEEVRAYYEQNRERFDFSESVPPGTAPAGEAGSGPPSGEAGEGGSTSPVEAPRPSQTNDAENATPTENAEPPAETDAPQEEAPAAPETPEGQESSSVSRNGLEFVAFQAEEAPASGGQTAAVEAPIPATGDENTPPAAEAPVLPAPAAAAPAAEPSQETLDAIREDLLNQRAREAADAKLEKVLDDMHALVERIMDAVPLPTDPQDEEQQRKYEADRRAAVQKVVAEMKAYAEENGLNFETTPLLGAEELYESEDYPIGSAVRWEKNAPLFGRDTTPLAQTIFLSSPDQPLSPLPAQNLLNESRYVALKIADFPPHVPTLDKKEVREEVVRQWKLRQARDLAQERAEQLAKKADTSEADLAADVADQTVTGKKDGQSLTARQVGPFTWLRRSTVPGGGFQLPDIVPNELPQLPGTGEEFMQAVFEGLEVGETGVAPAADGSAYYVVEVDRRSSDEELAAIREEFLKENPFFFLSPFRMQMFRDANELRGRWLEAFRERHEVVIPPDMTQDQPAA